MVPPSEAKTSTGGGEEQVNTLFQIQNTVSVKDSLETPTGLAQYPTRYPTSSPPLDGA